ncbi:MAG: MFS transporter [candidate division KSB1 bacterium]|nr:MFS transporter [candidate division KSB1 bacterium]MDZ7335098.1 MFS transporter [candidate division KSB1 bacterium]MDZ7356233.1 MFS transporter [candidate division KSB1 bacterium]MDZ7400038.1 MFS transporter [candidate division KSB1 bacterium]
MKIEPTAHTLTGLVSHPKRYRTAINAWCMYDWADSAFATTIMAALFPPFYRSLVTNAGLAENQATAYWGYTTSIALIAVALIAPILGAIADHTGGKKRYIALFVAIGVIATASFVFIGSNTWLLGSLLYSLGNFGFAAANIFYESLLPHLAQKNDIDQISTRGYAFGYIGGGILLIVNALWIAKYQWFGMPDIGFALRASFFSVAVWWALFSIPLFRHVPEPPVSRTHHLSRNVIVIGFSRLAATYKEISRYKQLLIFLIAFWLYNDGINTIIKMATAYGDELGIRVADMTLALILTQFVGVPFSFLFGKLAQKITAKFSILLALSVYLLISIGGFFMQNALHFYMLAFLVGTVQGGSQALSRSLYGSMVPKHKTAEFFGFFSTSSKFAGIAGPLLFGLVSQISGASRLSILSLIGFFLLGGVILLRVNVQEGIVAARNSEIAHDMD